MIELVQPPKIGLETGVYSYLVDKSVAERVPEGEVLGLDRCEDFSDEVDWR